MDFICHPFGYVTPKGMLIKDIERVINFYTPIALYQMSHNISKELAILDRAVMLLSEKEKIDPIHLDILKDVQLIDIVCHYNTHLKDLLSIQQYVYYSKDIWIKNLEFTTKIYQIYKDLGGNENVVIFGLAEFLARTYDIQRDDIQIIYKLLQSVEQQNGTSRNSNS